MADKSVMSAVEKAQEIARKYGLHDAPPNNYLVLPKSKEAEKIDEALRILRKIDKR